MRARAFVSFRRLSYFANSSVCSNFNIFEVYTVLYFLSIINENSQFGELISTSCDLLRSFG